MYKCNSEEISLIVTGLSSQKIFSCLLPLIHEEINHLLVDLIEVKWKKAFFLPYFDVFQCACVRVCVCGVASTHVLRLHVCDHND